MAFVSYAQNFEDVMLWRALKHVKKGFYVDVGARHPVIDSVSKAFYERGWRGMHIQPVPQYAELLRKERPDETILQIALGEAEGTLELNVIPDMGLSTFMDGYAHFHKVKMDYDHQRMQVPVLSLKSVLRPCVGKEVHWLKVDVHRFQQKVFEGWDSNSLRPWIIVVEASSAKSSELDCRSWETILIAAEYQFLYFDGLNRFYISKEHADLAEAFSSPPNVLDDVVLAPSSYLCRELIAVHHRRETELVTRAENLRIELSVANEHVARLQAQAEAFRDDLDSAKQRAEELSRYIGRLQGDLESEQQRALDLDADLQEARGREIQLRADAESLKNEREAARAKIDELKQSTHHWCTVAHQVSQELQSVYCSKSWRLIWPLRKTMQAAGGMSARLACTGGSLLRVAKRKTQTLVVSAVRKAISNRHLKSGVSLILAGHPELKHRLRRLAMQAAGARGWFADPISGNPVHGVPHNTSGSTSLPPTAFEIPNNLSPRAARVYAELKKAIEVKRS